MKFNNTFSLWGLVILWCGLIFSFSSIPTITTSEILWWDFVLKKTAHVLEYAVLYFLVIRALNKDKRLKIKKWWIAFIFCFLYALSDEYHQSFVLGRHAKLMDVGFDSLGMFLSYKNLQKNGRLFKYLS